MMKLSHSAANTFQTCGQKYKYHYIDKIREVRQSAALQFGTAVDNAVGLLLNDLKDSKVDPSYSRYHDAFNKAWAFGTINGKLESLKTCDKLVYSYADFDKVLIQDTHTDLTRFNMLTRQKKEQGLDSFRKADLEYYNSINWECLGKKGHLMIKAFVEQIVPQIKKVHFVQKEIKLENEDSDYITGFIDFVVEWKDGRHIIFDLKTSSIEYEHDSVKTSQQLTLYRAALREDIDTEWAGYVVLRKNILKDTYKECKSCGYVGDSRAKTCDATIKGKRCMGEWDEKITPKAQVQLIIDKVEDHTENMILENMTNINKLIKTGIFTRNFNACDSPFPCAYKNLCFKNDTTGLDIKVDK